jgi:PKD repeat protein
MDTSAVGFELRDPLVPCQCSVVHSSGTGSLVVRYKTTIRYSLLLGIATFIPVLLLGSIPPAHAAGTYTLYVVYPGYAQEGGTNALVLTVTGANVTTYRFRFIVLDPATKVFQSILYNYTNFVPNGAFSLPPVVYPSPGFQGSNDLVGQYFIQVNQVAPVPKTNVASNSFYFILTDLIDYQRTQTVGVQATGYNATEPVRVTIRPTASSINVYDQTIPATSGGAVTTSWKTPRNATIGNYLLTLTGTTTVKNPSDIQGFVVHPATLTITSLTANSSTYQRTQTLKFSFQSQYPDGTLANTGTASLTLMRPDRVNVTITASFDNVAGSFVASYKTSANNETGTWTAILPVGGFDDSNGNTGPTTQLTATTRLNIATLTVTVSATSYVPVGQSLQVNATITYPDGSLLPQSGSVGAYVLYSGSPAVNDTVPIVYNSGQQLWKGLYSPTASDPGGLWSLVVKASDSSAPANTGSATDSVTFQDHSPVASFTSSTLTALTGVSINLNATASYDSDGTIASWSWTFGDGSSGVGSTTAHTFSTSGIYTVTLTVTDNAGLTASATAQITITDRQPTVSFSPSSTTPSSGQTVTLSISASDPDGSISSVMVDWGDGTIHNLSGVATGDTHSYTLTGSSAKAYTITITVTDNSGSTSTSTSNLSVQPAPGNSSSGTLSLPLYYFGILAVAIGALLIGGFLAFRRHRVTHAKLKIDLEAVRSEAGRIENQDFFQSVKDQLKKDKDD